MSHTKQKSYSGNSDQSKKLKQHFMQRFLWKNIKKERKYIKYMNSHLEICIQPFLKDKEFAGKSEMEIIQILQSVPIFKVIYNTNNGKPFKVKVSYANADRILLITGISQPYLTSFISQFEEQRRIPVNFKIQNNESWSSIEVNNPQIALLFKRFLRNKKITYDLETDQAYRIPKRKVRIVLLMQDFFNILLDIIAQQSNHSFSESFNQSAYLGYRYYPLHFDSRQNKKNEIEEIYFYDDISEDMISKSSQLHQKSRLNEIEVETKNQGIQFQGEKFEEQQTRDITKGILTQTDQQQIKKQQNGYTLRGLDTIDENNRQYQMKQEIGVRQDSGIKQEIYTKEGVEIPREKSDQYSIKAESIEQQIKLCQQQQKKNVFQDIKERPSINSCNSLQVQENNQIGVQVKQIKETLAESQQFKVPSVQGSKKNTKKYVVSSKQQELMFSTHSLPSKKIRLARKTVVSTQKVNGQYMSRTTSIPFLANSSQQIEINKPIELTGSPLAKILTTVQLQQPSPSKVDPQQKQQQPSPKKEQGQGNNDVSIEPIELTIQQKKILQLNFAAMKRKQNEYLHKIGRKQLDIPQYIKKRREEEIFKEKFFEQIIRHANQSKKNEKY